jgi:hypothetical protein
VFQQLREWDAKEKAQEQSQNGLSAERVQTPTWIRTKKINHFNIATIQEF